MNVQQLARIFTLIVLGSSLLSGCNFPGTQKRKIVYINSYHKGHPSSDEIMEGFIKNMPVDSFKIYSWYMDTKRNPSLDFIQKKANELLDSIKQIDPDLLVVSDDNAVKYIVNSNLHDLSMPIVYCGVNWTDQEYNLPREKVTGILEILPVADAIKLIQQTNPQIKDLLVLNENTTTSRKEEQILDTLFQRFDLDPSYKLVDDFEQWKMAFITANTNYDVIYISTHAAIKGWNHNEAVEFIKEHIKVPVFTCEDFMMPYAVLGVTKIAEEHGIWSAKTAKKILNGKATGSIPIARNKESNLWINHKLANKINFIPDPKHIEKAHILND